MRLSIAALAALSIVVTSNAQDSNPAATEAFHDYFEPFLEGEWLYHIQLRDKDGKVIYEGDDYRTYKLGVSDRFVIEDIYADDEDGNRNHVAIQLIGLNPKAGAVDFSSFWPWSSTSTVKMRATISNDDGVKSLKGMGVPAGQHWPRIHLVCTMQSDTSMVCKTEGELEDGTRFDRSDETFSRL